MSKRIVWLRLNEMESVEKWGRILFILTAIPMVTIFISYKISVETNDYYIFGFITIGGTAWITVDISGWFFFYLDYAQRKEGKIIRTANLSLLEKISIPKTTNPIKNQFMVIWNCIFCETAKNSTDNCRNCGASREEHNQCIEIRRMG